MLLAFALGNNLGWTLGGISTLHELSVMLEHQLTRARALHHVNAGREVKPSERERLMRLSHELKPKFPKAAPRYREIARRLSTPKTPLKESRVRYIIEGPRKAKKKS